MPLSQFRNPSAFLPSGVVNRKYSDVVMQNGTAWLPSDYVVQLANPRSGPVPVGFISYFEMLKYWRKWYKFTTPRSSLGPAIGIGPFYYQNLYLPRELTPMARQYWDKYMFNSSLQALPFLCPLLTYGEIRRYNISYVMIGMDSTARPRSSGWGSWSGLPAGGLGGSEGG
jgi:hypothetical protein